MRYSVCLKKMKTDITERYNAGHRCQTVRPLHPPQCYTWVKLPPNPCRSIYGAWVRPTLNICVLGHFQFDWRSIQVSSEYWHKLMAMKQGKEDTWSTALLNGVLKKDSVSIALRGRLFNTSNQGKWQTSTTTHAHWVPQTVQKLCMAIKNLHMSSRSYTISITRKHI